MASIHPTKDALIRTVATLMEHNTVESITSDQVLEVSGISRGSLYHHFEDFSEVIEAAQVFRFGQFVDRTCVVLAELLVAAQSREEMLNGLVEVTRNTQSEYMRAARMERIGAISKSNNHPRMQAALGAEQERLTQAIADIYREACEKGWGNKKIEPRTVAVFIQAYTMGKAVDDFTPEHMSAENWNYLIGEILSNLFLNPEA